MRIAALVLTAVLGSSLTAAAQPGLTPVQEPDAEQPTQRASSPMLPPPPPVAAPGGYYVYGPMPGPMPLPAPMIEGKTKSEGTATMLSLGTTAAGFALLASAANQDNGGGMGTLGVLALLIGPSAGHIYAGETGHAVGMSLVRGGAAIAFLAGVIKATTVYATDSGDCIDWCNSGDSDNGATLMWVGGLTFVAATVYDIIDAPRAARRRNAKERQFAVQPMFVGTAANSKTPGIGFAGKF